MTRKSHQTMSALAKKWYVSFVPEGRKAKEQLNCLRLKTRRKPLLFHFSGRARCHAGTVNPHLPKRTISSADAKMWAQSE